MVGRLPDQADPPEVAKADSDSQPIIIVFLRSTSMNRLQLTDYADRYLVDRMATVPGVAQVNIYGEQRYSMRIWLDSAAMAARGLTVNDVETALTNQNVELPAGSLESTAKNYTVAGGRAPTPGPDDFPPVAHRHAGARPRPPHRWRPARASGSSAIIQGQPTYVTRLGDIARCRGGAGRGSSPVPRQRHGSDRPGP